MVRKMGRYTTVSAKIDKELKEKLVKYKINVSKVIKRALEEEVRRREEEELEKMLTDLEKAFEKIDIHRIVKSIREDREGR